MSEPKIYVADIASTVVTIKCEIRLTIYELRNSNLILVRLSFTQYSAKTYKIKKIIFLTIAFWMLLYFAAQKNQ